MEFSPHIYFGLTLKPGAVYYYVSDGLRSSAVPHYHVVLSVSDPERVMLVYASTKIEQRRQFTTRHHCPPETLVLASPATETYLSAQSAFDCNRPVVESLRSLAGKYARRRIPVMGPASPLLVRQLVNGVLRSPLVARQYQELLRMNLR